MPDLTIHYGHETFFAVIILAVLTLTIYVLFTDAQFREVIITQFGKKPLQEETVQEEAFTTATDTGYEKVQKTYEEFLHRDYATFPTASTLGYSSYGAPQEGFQEGLDDPLAGITKFFNSIGKFFEAIIDFLEQLPSRMEALAKGTMGTLQSLVDMTKSLTEIVTVGTEDVTQLIRDSPCGINMFYYHFVKCLLWLTIDAVLGFIRTIVITLPIFIIKRVTRLDLQPILEKFIYKPYTTKYKDEVNDSKAIVNILDRLIYRLARFHIIRFPNDVLDDCYACDLLQHTEQLLYDFFFTFPPLILDPVLSFLGNFPDIIYGLYIDWVASTFMNVSGVLF